jgi:hypothetical protein
LLNEKNYEKIKILIGMVKITVEGETEREDMVE